jgi:hypothetical protein
MQCLDILSGFPEESSNGIVVFDNGSLLDISTSQISSMSESTLFNVVMSLDKTLIAFKRIMLNDQHRITSKELVVATADGRWLKTIPWEEDWLDLLQWTSDQRLLISYDEPFTSSDGQQISISYLALDPFTGEQQILRPDFPDFLDVTTAWGWQGVRHSAIYDPALTRAIYARLMGDGKEMYTFALWDVENRQLVTGLEDVYTNPVIYKVSSPIPIWSPDGSQFVFRGQVLVPEESVAFELYRVSRDGQVEQLTHLSPAARVQSRSLSWSPDGRYIALFLDAWYGSDNKRMALLDMETLGVTDYCLPVRGAVPAPIWSPDGTQFLVVDRYTEDHQRVILIDVVQGFAAVIAEDVEPVGWMVAPEK